MLLIKINSNKEIEITEKVGKANNKTADNAKTQFKVKIKT